jgi:hypothetical protein
VKKKTLPLLPLPKRILLVKKRLVMPSPLPSAMEPCPSKQWEPEPEQEVEWISFLSPRLPPMLSPV